jgi:hypothetical protein
MSSIKHLIRAELRTHFVSELKFEEVRKKIQINEEIFKLEHPVFSGKYRWTATLFRHRLTDEYLDDFGPNEELYFLYKDKQIRSDPNFKLDGKTKSEKIINLVHQTKLPDFRDPSVYLEVYSIPKNTKESFRDCYKCKEQGEGGMLSGKKSSISVDEFQPGHKDWCNWWGNKSERTERLELYAGQANGAHHWGWEARGGRSLECIPSQKGFKIFNDPDTDNTVYANRAGFILFNIQKQVEGTWVSILQGQSDQLNPLATPLYIDKSEHSLISTVEKWKDTHPILFHTTRANSTPEGVDNIVKVDLDIIGENLSNFIRSYFHDDWLVWFGKSLTGKSW